MLTTHPYSHMLFAAFLLIAVLLVVPPSTFAAAQDICPEDLASYVNEVSDVPLAKVQIPKRSCRTRL